MSQRDASAILMDQVLRYDLGRLAAQVMRDIDENKEMRQVLLGSIVEAPPDALDVVGEMFFTTALDVQMERSIAVGWYWYIAGAITDVLQRKLDLFDSSKLFNPGVLSETSGLCSDEELRKAIMALGYGLCEARRCFDVILAAQLVIHAYGEPSCRGFIPSWPNAIEVVDYRADFEQIRPLADRAGAQELQKTYADFEQLLAGRSGEDYTRALRYYLGPVAANCSSCSCGPTLT